MRRALIAALIVLGACVTEDPPRLDVRVHGRAFATATHLVFQIRIGNGDQRAVGGRVYALTPEGIDLSAGPVVFGLREAEIKGPVAVWVVACDGSAGEVSCDTEDLTNSPSCSCDAPLAAGLGQATVEGLTRLDVFLGVFGPDCDADGDLFLDCDTAGCCEEIPADVVGDCNDRPSTPGCPEGKDCHGRRAHPFHAAELDFDAARTDAQRERHLTWCGDLLDNDCDGTDVQCGGDDADGDGSPAHLDCDDSDPEVYPGRTEDGQTRCSDGIDHDCQGGDVRCDLDMDGADDLEDCDDGNPDRFPGNPERCGDGVDQDCDEHDPICVSDDLDGDGYLCPVTPRWGPHVCSGNGPDGRPQDCDDLDAGVFPGAPERCNGIDDDCDGTTDEGCPGGDGDRDGVADVNQGGADCDDTNPEVHPGAPERCDDGIDQDCDGRDAPCATDADSDGFDAAVDCADGDPTVHPWAPEWCNGIDDDCDGRVDEGNPRQTSAEGAVQPAECGTTCVDCDCRQAPLVCSTNGRGEVALEERFFCLGVAPGERAESICDGIDQDCDGRWDEAIDRPCFTGGAAARDIGVCIDGTETCAAVQGSGMEGWSICADEIVPSDEVCNGLDDDCDNSTDEGRETRACYEGPNNTRGVGECRDGTQICNGADGYGACEDQTRPADELCNDLDDDCDGNTDEGFRLGRDCAVGRGECRREGSNICRNDRAVCSANPGQPMDEACNGRDDDCDGNTDEGVLNACGECGNVPAEVCNRRDDDCDGRTDEGVQNACGRCGDVPVEICDGVDNDCNGDIDDNPTDAGDGCAVGQGACRNEGREQCSGGRLICNARPGRPSPEACNRIDDDCDGRTDEDIPAITCGLGVCEVTVIGCSNGMVPACMPGPPRQEVCNGLDDNCDGNIDETAPDLDRDINNCGACGRRCEGGNIDGCHQGNCSCGDRGRPCPDGEACVEGECQ